MGKQKTKQLGRPSRYCTDLDELVYNYCLLGATNEQLALYFQVSITTLENWINRHRSFFGALKAGKQEADAIIAQSLFHRAKGYSHPEDKIFYDAKSGETAIVPTIKHYPPDTTACIFWLKNRRKDEWRDRKEVAGTVEHNHRHAVMAVSRLDEFLIEATGQGGADAVDEGAGQERPVLPAPVPAEET